MKIWHLVIEIVFIIGALALFVLGEYMFSYMVVIMASLCRIEHKLEEIKGDKNGRN